MARFKVTKVKEFSVLHNHSASDWEVYRDDTMSDLLFSTENDELFLTTLVCALKNDDGTPYLPDASTFARVRFHYGDDYVTEWFNLDRCDCEGALPYDLPGILASGCGD
jgi:hypothetical protein